MRRKTKIVCTLGPAVSRRETLKELMLSGMDVARFNFSHADHASHQKMFDMVDSLRKELNLPVATMLDTKGPEIRTGVMKDGPVTLEAGKTLVLTPEDVPGTAERISVSHKELYRDVKEGCFILIDDGLIELKVTAIEGEEIICEILNGGVVSDRKGINVPGVELSLPYLSQRDIDDIRFGVRTGFDFIAASFVTTPNDILQIRKLLESEGCQSILVIAKIESAKAVENIEEILRVSDGVMVARGDMGVEIPAEDVPVVQKQLIKKALSLGKISITATQMLDSMTTRPRPTRAEAADVANAIYDGTSAVMLSGETASGKYPIEAVRMMATIAQRTERDINYRKRLNTMEHPEHNDLTYAIAHATCTIAHDLNAGAIVPVTQSGYTARMTSSFRPAVPIVACTPKLSTYRHLSLSWGVTPVLMSEHVGSTDLMLHEAVDSIRSHGLVRDGEVVVLTAGVPIGIPGTTNLVKVDVVGDVICSGLGIGKGKVIGRLCVVQNEEEAIERFTDGDILVIPRTTNAIMPLLKRCSGIVAEEEGANSHAAVVGLTLDIPAVVGVKNACALLKNGVTVYLDASRGAVGNSVSVNKTGMRTETEE